MSRIGRVYGPRPPRRPVIPTGVPDPDVVNREGFPQWSPSWRERVAEVLMLGTFGNAFYASGRELAAEALDVLREGVEADPLFVARAAVLARQQGYIRSAPIVALALLTAGPREAKGLADRIAPLVLRTADDVRRFVEFVHTGAAGRKFGGKAQRIVRDWLASRLDEYGAMKYAGTGSRWSLRNILRMTHPRTADQVRNAVLRWLVRGDVDPEKTPRIAALESLRSLDCPRDIASAVERFGLPYEAVLARVPRDPEVAEALLTVAPYFNLLRGIVEFGRDGLWLKPGNVQVAVQRLTDAQVIRRARILPFRFLQALRAVEGEYVRLRSTGEEVSLPPEFGHALRRAMEISVDCVPGLGARLCLAPDVSGSMVGGTLAPITVAGLFTAALWKANPDAIVLPWNGEVRRLRDVSPSDTLATITSHIEALGGGSTNMAAPVRELADRREKVDVFVGLTDNEDWDGPGFLGEWDRYVRTVAPGARAVLITLVPYGTRPTPRDYPGVRYVYGWSDAVLRIVAWAASGKTFSEMVEQVRIGEGEGGAADTAPLASVDAEE